MKTKNIFSISALLIILAIAGYYIYNNLSDFKSLTLVNPLYLIILIALFILTYLFIGLVTQNLLYPLGVKLKGFEVFALSIVTGFYNLITPFRGGMATRAVYLKKKHSFPYVHFLASLAGMYVISFLIASLLGIISTILIYLTTGIFSTILFLIFLGIFIPLLAIIILSPKFPEHKNKWINRFIKVINGWHLIKSNLRIIFIISIITLIQFLIGSVMFYLQFRVFGINMGFFQCIFLSAIGNLSLLVSITPANLGVQEAITVFSALTIGITPEQSLSVALLARAIQMIVLFVLGPIFSVILFKHRPKIPQNEIKNNSYFAE